MMVRLAFRSLSMIVTHEPNTAHGYFSTHYLLLETFQDLEICPSEQHRIGTEYGLAGERCHFLLAVLHHEPQLVIVEFRDPVRMARKDRRIRRVVFTAALCGPSRYGRGCSFKRGDRRQSSHTYLSAVLHLLLLGILDPGHLVTVKKILQ